MEKLACFLGILLFAALVKLSKTQAEDEETIKCRKSEQSSKISKGYLQEVLSKKFLKWWRYLNYCNEK